MPFTFSHTAVILPFRLLPKRWLSLTGLVVGSVVPDFEKFIKMEPGNSLSHNWEGVFFFNLPLGLLLCFLFHNIVRNPLIDHLPVYFHKRFHHIKCFNWPNYLRRNMFVVVFSILIGAISHIAWDSMTHQRGLIVRLIPYLTQGIVVGKVVQPIYSILDIVSTVVGGGLVLLALIQLPVKERQKLIIYNKPKSKFWLKVILIAMLTMLLRGMAGLGKEWHWELIITSISSVLIGIFLSSLHVKLKGAYSAIE